MTAPTDHRVSLASLVVMPKAVQPAIATDEILFELERFELVDQQLRLAGRWFGVRGRRFVRPTLTPLSGRDLSRVLADLEHKPWAAEDGTTWEATFPWDRNGAGAKFELSVAPDIVILLPSPKAKLTLPRRLQALPRQPAVATVWRYPKPEQVEDRGPGATYGAEAAAVPEPEPDPVAELEIAKTQLAGLEEQLAVARDDLAAAVAAREAAAAQGAAAIAELDQLRSENDELRAERDELSAAQAELSLTDTELRQAHTELTAANAELNADRDELTRERDRLIADLAAGERLVRELRSELDRATTTVQQAKRERDDAITAHGAAMVMRRATRAGTATNFSHDHSPLRTALAVVALVVVVFAILIVAHVL